MLPIFTPPRTQPIERVTSIHDEEAAIQASLQSDASGISLSEIQTARGLADILSEMLGALDPKSPEGVKQDVIVDVVEQCRSYQKSVMILVNNTENEELLCQGLALNDDLQRVLSRHEDIVTRSSISVGATRTPIIPPVNINDESDDESDDGFAQLVLRSSRHNSQGVNAKPAAFTTKSIGVNPLLPPPPASKSPVSINYGFTDYLSGDFYKSEGSSEPSKQTTSVAPIDSNTKSYPSTTRPLSPPIYDEPAPLSKSDDQLPPPSKHKSISENETYCGTGSFYGNQSGTGSSYDNLVGQTQTLSLNSSSSPKQYKLEDDLFKDLADYGKAKSYSPKPNRS